MTDRGDRYTKLVRRICNTIDAEALPDHAGIVVPAKLRRRIERWLRKLVSESRRAKRQEAET